MGQRKQWGGFWGGGGGRGGGMGGETKGKWGAGGETNGGAEQGASKLKGGGRAIGVQEGWAKVVQRGMG